MTVRPESCTFRMPDIMCLVSVVFVCGMGLVKMRTLPPIFLLSKKFGFGLHGRSAWVCLLVNL